MKIKPSSRKKLDMLRQISLDANVESDVPIWIRQQIDVNFGALLDSDATRQAAINKLIGACRAIYDACTPRDDDPIVAVIGELLDELKCA